MSSKNKLKILRAQLVELFTRETEYNKQDKYYENGAYNKYPQEIERVIFNSPTATRSVLMFSKFIKGQGVEDDQNIVVNRKKMLKVNDLISLIADDIAVQNGCYIHVGYGILEGEIKPVSYSVLDYQKCRISKEDSEGNEGKIIYDDFDEEKAKTFGNKSKDAKKTEYFPYSNNPEVILARIKKETGAEDLETAIKKFKGQVYYLNLTPRYVYALSPFDSVYNDCDTEYRIGLYSNTMCRGGFLGKTAILTQGLDDEVSETIVEDIKKWLGAENSSSLYHLDVEEVDDLDNVLKILQVESQFDDAMFENTIKRVRKNILGCANNIPEALVFSGEGALFGTNAETYNEMKEFYNEQTSAERNKIEETLDLLGLENVKIIPVEKTEMVKKEEKVEIKKEI